jgi:hypothetical protein
MRGIRTVFKFIPALKKMPVEGQSYIPKIRDGKMPLQGKTYLHFGK